MHAQSLSRAQLFVIPWNVACQAPLPMGFLRQEYWNELSFPSPGYLPDPGIEPTSSSLAGGFFLPLSHQKLTLFLDPNLPPLSHPFTHSTTEGVPLVSGRRPGSGPEVSSCEMSSSGPQQLFSRSAVSNSLRLHALQHARPPCPSPSPGVYANSCPLSQ